MNFLIICISLDQTLGVGKPLIQEITNKRNSRTCSSTLESIHSLIGQPFLFIYLYYSSWPMSGCHATWSKGGGEEKKKELRSCVAHFFFSLLSELLLLHILYDFLFPIHGYETTII